ncbi:MAG: helix-turn-helix domain-containing protein [Nitrospirota bacterium]|nr:helix-turn-helix domain-containing protein [Nitrospirota bacterium]
MNLTKLKKLLSSGETETVEFKEKPNESFYKNISSFANTKGGIILLGVDKKSNIIGIETTSKFLEDLTNRIVNKLSIYPEIDTIDINRKRVIAVKIIRSGFPVSYEGRYYERVGNTTREMNSEKLRALLSGSKPWDSLTGKYSPEEIDAGTIDLFVRLAVDKKRLTDLSLNDKPQVILEKLGLRTDKNLTNGAILLFGKNPQKHFINLCVRIGRFKTETTIIDDKWVKGNLFKQFEDTVNLLKQFISVRYEIKDFQREDIWDYPIPALREAVLNAIIHRDYFNIANFILIKVYDDHIWISNPGGLPEGITVEELKRPHKSFVRNPLIAKVFYLAGFIEQYGSGTVRMTEWMKETGLPEPEFKEEMGGFSVYFYKDVYTEENLKKMGLNERQIKAVMYVKEQGKITNKEYREIFTMTDRTALRDLTDICEKGVFQKVGKTGRKIEYIITRQKPDKPDKNQTEIRQNE